jgi:hypothetical protein
MRAPLRTALSPVQPNLARRNEACVSAMQKKRTITRAGGRLLHLHALRLEAQAQGDIQNWNVLLDPTMPPRFTGRSQAAKPALCLRSPPAAKIMPKMLPAAAASPIKLAANSCIRLAASRKTLALLTDADAVSLKSP